MTQSLAKNIKPIHEHGANVLYQHGTLALLVPGLLEGTTTIGELLKHGDTGIGTGEGLDGELIILDGVAYKVANPVWPSACQMISRCHLPTAIGRHSSISANAKILVLRN